MYSKPVLLNMPQDILEGMNYFADLDGRPRTKQINDACREWITKRQQGTQEVHNENHLSEPVSFFSSSGTGF
jgi:hypothetical protein